MAIFLPAILIAGASLFRSGIRSLLQRHAEFAIVDDAVDGVDGIKKVVA
jgi:two-component system nitrate/nitrite response regulator NarL